jgi:alpha/beta superfamily hydrolase
MIQVMHDLRVKSKVRSFFLQGPAGRLEALLNEGVPEATHAALVCHPHPLYGGTMHNRVVFHATKALNSFGFPVFRFNFRGAGMSAGEHDYGKGEVEDVRAALEWLYGEFRLPVVFAGFSFGAAIGLKALSPDPRVSALIAIGAPVLAEGREYQYDFLQDCRKPKLFLSGGCDPYGPRDRLKQVVESLPEPKRLLFVDGADHFFAGHEEQMRQVLEECTRAFLAGNLQ